MSSPVHSPLPDLVVRSRYAHVISLDEERAVLVHAIERTRIVVRRDVVSILEALDEPEPALGFVGRFSSERGIAEGAVTRCVEELLQNGLLFAGTPAEESAKYERLAAALVRGDAPARAEWDRKSPRNMDRYAAVRVARDVASFAPLTHSAAVLVIGFCDVHFASDLLRDDARSRGIELRVDAVFEMDVNAAAEQPYDFVIIGALAARHGHWFRSDGEGDLSPRRYLGAVKSLIARLRALTQAPILINNAVVPTLSPGGLADAFNDSPIRRARAINDALLELASASSDVHVVDIDAALSRVGKKRTLDDQLVPTSHLGGIGWWSMLPEHELRTVHGVPFEERIEDAFQIDDAFAYDRAIVSAQMDWIQTLLGAGRRKCVIVDLDNTLWPGVLADTGSPFPLDLDHTLFSFHSIYVGLHQALKALEGRGILLACVSKNDEPVIRSLWRYPPSAPRELLLTPDDFVTWRINWNEKSDNIRAIAGELGLGLDSIVFIDDHPVERDKVRRFLPEVLVLGDSLLTLRSRLLTMPELQVVKVTDEAKERTETTRARLDRERLKETIPDPDEYRRSLGLRYSVERLGAEEDLERVHELILRTNQFNTTGWRVPKHELQAILREDSAHLHVLRVEDRFTNYGLVGACLVRGDSIDLFVMSCRVIGLGVEHALLRTAILTSSAPVVHARIESTDRNLPARNLFRDHGFAACGDAWSIDRAAIETLPPLDAALSPAHRSAGPPEK